MIKIPANIRDLILQWVIIVLDNNYSPLPFKILTLTHCKESEC
jgi:hypothetical protein